MASRTLPDHRPLIELHRLTDRIAVREHVAG
jgi:hypothetical protein